MENKISIDDSTGKIVPIEKVSKGNYFKFPGIKHKAVHIANGYNCYSKKYDYYSYKDVNKFGGKKKGTLVVIDFDF